MLAIHQPIRPETAKQHGCTLDKKSLVIIGLALKTVCMRRSDETQMVSVPVLMSDHLLDRVHGYLHVLHYSFEINLFLLY